MGTNYNEQVGINSYQDTFHLTSLYNKDPEYVDFIQNQENMSNISFIDSFLQSFFKSRSNQPVSIKFHVFNDPEILKIQRPQISIFFDKPFDIIQISLDIGQAMEKYFHEISSTENEAIKMLKIARKYRIIFKSIHENQ